MATTPIVFNQNDFGDIAEMTATFTERSPRDYTAGGITWRFLATSSASASPVIDAAIPAPTQSNVANADGTTTVTLTWDYTLLAGDLAAPGLYRTWIDAQGGGWERHFGEPPIEVLAAPEP